MRPLILSFLLAACGGPDAPPPAEALSWLAGTWTSDARGFRTVESWRPLPDGTLLGSGYASQTGGEVPGMERILIFAETMAVIDAPGGATLVTWPAGQEPVRYALASTGQGEVTFVNDAQPFPRRLTYRRTDALTLEVAAVGVGPEGQERVETWSLTRQ